MQQVILIHLIGPNLWDMGGGSITLEDLMNEDDISDEGVDPRDMFYSAAAGDMEVDGGLQSSASETEEGLTILTSI